MRNRRTDLALEARELWQESAEERTQLEGVEAREEMREGIPVTRVSILDRRGEEALGKPVGTYVTLTLDGLARREENAFGRAARAVAAELGELLGVSRSGINHRLQKISQLAKQARSEGEAKGIASDSSSGSGSKEKE